MSVARALYRQLLDTARKMIKDGLPCTGCVGLLPHSSILCPESFLAYSFRTQSSDHLSDAFHAMRMLPRQVAVLQACEEETRQALHQWQLLQRHWCKRSPLSSQQHLEAAESACWLLTRLTARHKQQQLLLEEDIEQLQQQTEESITAAQQQLDDWATAVRAAEPEAFTPGASSRHRLQQFQTLYQVLCQQKKLRCDPFEWVYEGLDPLLLPAVISKRKGIPLSLAIAAGAVARRLEMYVQLICADDSQIPGTSSGPLILQHMPPEIAARQAGRSLAGAPPPTSWLLWLAPAAGQQWAPNDQVYLDFSHKSKLLDSAACKQRYPELDNIIQQQEAASKADAAPHSSVIHLWADMARTMVMAHQRRGESDLVAHWLYQLLALDTTAEEWGHAMQR